MRKESIETGWPGVFDRTEWWKRVGLGRSIGVWVLMSRSYQRLFAVMVQVHETYTCQSFIATHPMIIDWLSAAETVLRSRLRNPVRGSGSRPCKHRRLKKRKHSMSKSDAKLVKQSEEIVKTILHRMSSEEVDEEWHSQEGQSKSEALAASRGKRVKQNGNGSTPATSEEERIKSTSLASIISKSLVRCLSMMYNFSDSLCVL